jgi:streptomycin 6-kinase
MTGAHARHAGGGEGGRSQLPPVPALLARDDHAGALLLEAIVPGRPLNEDAAPASAASVGRLLRELRGPAPPAGLLPLRERVDFCFELWLTRRAANPVARATVPDGALERGHALARSLAGDFAGPSALVHGDLHPGNVLDGGPGRGLVAIDPRACAGDPGFDAVDLILWGAETTAAARARIAAVALHAGDDPERLGAWCAALAAMSAASLARRPRPGTASRIETLLALSV